MNDPYWHSDESVTHSGHQIVHLNYSSRMKAKAVLILFSLVAMISATQSPTEDRSSAQDTQARGHWIDPSTGLMWAVKDNGKDVSWRKAMKYCHDLRLDGYSDWRLANMVELQGIYDKTVEAPGQAGPSNKLRQFTWHVKGNLFLTGDEWAGHQVAGRMPLESYENHFDFNEGRSDTDPSGWPYSSSGMRALCVRGPGR